MLDLITTFFELVTAVAIWLDVARLLSDRDVRGVSLLAVSFRTLGGFWAWYLLYELDLTLAVLTGAAWAVGALTWLGLATWYKYVPA